MPFALKNRLGTTQMVQPEGKRPIVWRPSGDPTGEDVQVMPDEMRTDISLNKAVRLGNLEMIDDEAAIDATWDKQREAGQAAVAAQDQTIASYVDTRNDENTMIGLTCIASGARAGTKCEATVILPLRDREKLPPLCQAHNGQSEQYVLVGGEQGKPDYWVRVKR